MNKFKQIGLLYLALALAMVSGFAADGDMPAAITTAVTSATTLSTTIIALVVSVTLAFIGISYLKKTKRGG